MRLHVHPQRAEQPFGIDAVMLVEAPVLHRDEGGGKVGRHLFQRQPLADNGASMADHLAARVQEGERHRPVDGIKVLGKVELGRERRNQRRQGVKQQQRQDDNDADPGPYAQQRHAVFDDPADDFVQDFLQALAHGRAKWPIFWADSRQSALTMGKVGLI